MGSDEDSSESDSPDDKRMPDAFFKASANVSNMSPVEDPMLEDIHVDEHVDEHVDGQRHTSIHVNT